MITRFKSGLDRVDAEQALLDRTEAYLHKALSPAGRKPSAAHSILSRSSLRGLAAVACMALFLIAGSAGAYNYYQTPVAYLSVDINPSVELALNPFNKVVGIEAYNADGQAILAGLQLEGLNVEEAIKLIIAAAANQGYIASDGSSIISFTLESDEERLSSELHRLANNGASEGLTYSGASARLVNENVPLSMHDEAQSIGITAGKLNLINKLQAVDPEATVEQYKDASVKEIIRDTQAARGKDQNGSSNKEDDIEKHEDGDDKKGSENNPDSDDNSISHSKPNSTGNSDQDINNSSDEDSPGPTEPGENNGQANENFDVHGNSSNHPESDAEDHGNSGHENQGDENGNSPEDNSGSDQNNDDGSPGNSGNSHH